MTTMIETILNILSEYNIRTFLINEDIIDTEELFFIKQNLNLSRNKSVSEYEITVYRDFNDNGTYMRGSASCVINNCMTKQEITKSILSTYEAALCVKNSYYKLPHGDAMFTESDCCNDLISLTNDMLNSFDIANAIFSADTNTTYFINSAEIFITTTKSHIINSNGINISYAKVDYSGEYVVQCTSPNDVELYDSFHFSSKDSNITDSLKAKVSSMLNMVKDRGCAITYNPRSAYDNIILEGVCVSELFNYYLKRLDASMIYQKYSTFNIDCPISKHTVTKDLINIFLAPKESYSREGIRLLSTPLISNNIAKCITGNSRFSFYLGLKPIGEYQSYKMSAGTTSLNEMERKPYLKIVNFSDFQMDELTGQFGGEFRLAYYYDGNTTTPVTNGSISGNINEIIKCITFSKEMQSSYTFNGPLAISFLRY